MLAVAFNVSLVSSKIVIMNIRNWFTTKIKYHKMDDHGKVKKVNEPYLVDAVSFTEAEARITKEMGAYIAGDFYVTNITKSNIAEVFHYDDSDVWYKSKVDYVDFDEESGREKKVSNTMITTAGDAREAYDRIQENCKKMLAEFEITQIVKTPIVEIFPYIPGEEVSENGNGAATVADQMVETANAFGELAAAFNANKDGAEENEANDEEEDAPEAATEADENDADSDTDEQAEDAEEETAEEEVEDED